MPARRALRWFAISALAQPFVLSCAAARSAAPHFSSSRFNPGSDLWFPALFTLRNPVEGGLLHFRNDHVFFTLSSVNFSVSMTQAVITFTTTDSTQSNALGGGQWISHLPYSFNEQGLFAGTSWDAAAKLAGGMNYTRFANLLVMVGATSHMKPRPR